MVNAHSPAKTQPGSKVLVVGLGPIGANTGARLVDRGVEVMGFDLDEARATGWTVATGAPHATKLDQIDRSWFSTVIVAVRTAEQVSATVAALADLRVGALTVFVLTTLAPTAAAEIFAAMPQEWRAFETPLSGGPQGARAGSMSIYVAGPELAATDRELLEAMSGRIFETEAYGKPAEFKLINNTLAAYTALATASMIDLARTRGLDVRDFLEVVSRSSGRSWVSDNFDNFDYELLFKDVRLLIGEVGPLPVIAHSMGDESVRTIERVRTEVERGA